MTRIEYRASRIETIARALWRLGYKRADDTWRAYIVDATAVLDALYPPEVKP